MIKIIISAFILGLSFGWGPCLASCGPLLVSYLVGTGRGVKKSLSAYCLFSLGRIAAYLALAMLIFFCGKFFFSRFIIFIKPALILGGAFVVILGLLIAFGWKVKLPVCAYLNRGLIERDKKSLLFLGVIIGFLPCAPLVALLSYIGLSSRSPFESLLYSFSFGLGTFISPLFVLAGLAGFIRSLIGQKSIKAAIFFNLISGFIIIFFGLDLLRRAF